jgi:UDP-N-acetyl-D-mannosaminuronate dehydrogenase
LITGLTYEENVPDTRESPVKEMVKELKEFCIDVYENRNYPWNTPGDNKDVSTP